MYVSLRPPTDRRLPGGAAVLLLGPPGSGKSTLSKELAFRHNARVFRLREYAQERAHADSVLAAAMREQSDALGWLPESRCRAAGRPDGRLPGSRHLLGALHATHRTDSRW
jgi:hypothetical protein